MTSLPWIVQSYEHIENPTGKSESMVCIIAKPKQRVGLGDIFVTDDNNVTLYSLYTSTSSSQQNGKYIVSFYHIQYYNIPVRPAEQAKK